MNEDRQQKENRMSKKSILETIIKEVELFFDDSPQKCFTFAELAAILQTTRETWELPIGVNAGKFVDFLEIKSHLRKIELESEHYGNVTRYIWKEPSPYLIAGSIKKKSFFSHGSAVELHSLTDNVRSEMYINYEQSAKPSSQGVLVQANVDRAFAGSQRQSKLTYEFESKKIIVINGKFTAQLGVEPLTDKSGNELRVTSIERTLIDITVRPSYVGTVFDVLEAFKKSKERVSVSTLVSMLKKIEYLYPYHQAIGFYMERAGFAEKDLSKLRKLGFDINFYLTYGLGEDKKYDSSWRIFYPKSL